MLSYSNTNTVLASGLTSSISLLPPITLDGARVIKTITYAYMPLPPASNVQVHNVTFTTIDTAVTGTDAGGTTSTGAVVSGWGPITAGSINQTTGAVTFSFEAVVCSGGTSIITVSGNTDGTNGSGIVTFTAGPDSCEIPSGTWSMEDSLAPVSVAGNWLFDLYNGSSATASLLQTSGNPDLISSTTGTGTLPGFGSYPINVSGTLDNSVASPKPIILTFTTDLSTIGCGIITVTATGIATATSMSGTYDSVSSTHIGACESSNVSWSGTKL